jgi:hypothetical protein
MHERSGGVGIRNQVFGLGKNLVSPSKPVANIMMNDDTKEKGPISNWPSILVWQYHTGG